MKNVNEPCKLPMSRRAGRDVVVFALDAAADEEVLHAIARFARAGSKVAAEVLAFLEEAARPRT